MKRPSFGGRHLAVPLVFALFGCGGDGDAGVPVNLGHPDILVGAEPVAGFQFLTTTYSVPGTGASRTLRLNLWYATTDAEGTPTRFNPISVDANSFLNASVRVPRGQAPLMVFSHGHTGFGGGNHAVVRQFVRNGWIVVAPDHTDDTTFDAIDPRPLEFEAVRAYDVRATLDFMESLPSDHPLSGHVDTSRVLVGGHSYGGLTAWIVGGPALDLDAIAARCEPDCVEAELDAYRMYSPDPRVVGVVALDGGISTDFVADAGFAAMTVPALFMTPTGNPTDMALFQRSTAADVTWIQLEGGCHHSFTGELGCPTLPLSTSLPITATYMLAFGIHTVLQSEDPDVLDILDGTTLVDPPVTYARHRR